MEQDLKVENVSMKSKGKNSSGGTVIKFSSDETIALGSKLSIQFNEQEHYFEVAEIDIDVDKLRLLIQASEVGYWARKLDRVKDFDPRDLLNRKVTLVTDADTLARISQESCWC